MSSRKKYSPALLRNNMVYTEDEKSGVIYRHKDSKVTSQAFFYFLK
jgi:hypothetical protein